ncbi:MAG TPA: DMT family transporter [Nitrolancea sp.]|nr:DMT family transporter [Nitrolancea sp.]
MSSLALALVLSAACLHATWNLLVKRVAGGPEFIWLFGTLSTLIYAPVVAFVLIYDRPYIGPIELLFIVGSGIIHIGYFLILQQGYRVGDLSLVYPLARGTGPTLATIGAIIILGERPSLLGLVGAVIVIASVFIFTGGPTALRKSGNHPAIFFGLLTGIFIATYTLWDKHAVSTLMIPPLIQDIGSSAIRSSFLAPIAIRRPAIVRALWSKYRWETLGVAILSPLAYMLVLTAMSFTPVSYVSPAREVSILIGTLMGARLLSEGEGKRRLVAAGMMVVGITALALG